MSASFISATNVFIVPPPVTNPAASKKKFIAKLDERCRALTKLPGARDHSGPQCSRRKVLNTDIPQAEKTLKDIAADELCNQHKLMLDRFIVSQAKLDFPSHPAEFVSLGHGRAAAV